jgi:hypothetical protein
VQVYEYLSTGSLVRAEGIFTSLLFDHALRIRIKASTSTKESSADAATGSPRKDSGDSLVGKMNSLITSDLANITRGRDFLNLGTPFFFLMMRRTANRKQSSRCRSCS